MDFFHIGSVRLAPLLQRLSIKGFVREKMLKKLPEKTLGEVSLKNPLFPSWNNKSLVALLLKARSKAKDNKISGQKIEKFI